MIERYYDLWRQQAVEAAAKKVADLTEDEKIALAWAAGCPITVEDRGTGLRVWTQALVGFADGDDGKLIVAIHQRSAGDTVTLDTI